MKANKRQSWVPRWLANMPKNWERPSPVHPANETNHQRALRQRHQRELKKDMFFGERQMAQEPRT